MPSSSHRSSNQRSVSHASGSASPGGSSQSSSSKKRSTAASSPATSTSDGGFEQPAPRRKAYKVSRACDLCKAKKAKCTGTKPCDSCVKKGVPCVYDAKYSRGRPPTPPPSLYYLEQQNNSGDEQSTTYTPIEDKSDHQASPQVAPLTHDGYGQRIPSPPMLMDHYMHPDLDAMSMMQPRPQAFDMFQPTYSMADAYPKLEADPALFGMPPMLNHWQTADWMDVNSSAFNQFNGIDHGMPLLWMSDVQ